MLLPTRTGPDAGTRTESTWWAETMASDVWIVAVLIAIGAALRFGTIASQSYWLDEAATVHLMGL